MRIGSHYRSRTLRLLFAFVTLVYAGALSGGLVFHMVEEGAEVQAAVLMGSETNPGEPTPLGHEIPDDLDCLLCQVMTSPGHLAPEAPTFIPHVLPEAPPAVAARSAQDRTALARNARAPPRLI